MNSSLLITIPVILIALTIHECAHAIVAYKLGDKAAKDRITLNPIKHIDPFGFLLLLIVNFGWAKPVSVNQNVIKNPKLGMILVAVAGPFSNLALAVISGGFTGVLLFLGSIIDINVSVFNFLINISIYSILINLILFGFNLIPIPPLDGGRILEQFIAQKYHQTLNIIGMIAIPAIVFLGIPFIRAIF